MPIVTLTVRKPKTAEFKTQVLSAVHTALQSVGVHPNDLFQRVLELDAIDFRFDATFGDARTARTDAFVLIEILLGAGRSVKVKKQILARLVTELNAIGFDPEHMMLCFQDVPWENWSPAGGRMPHG